MFKKFLIFIVPILFLSACATKQDTFAQVNQISKILNAVLVKVLMALKQRLKGFYTLAMLEFNVVPINAL